jgi:hypothetical protein
MLTAVPSELLFPSRTISLWYWYYLAMPCLVLDRSTRSVTLEVSLHEVCECLRQTFLARGRTK